MFGHALGEMGRKPRQRPKRNPEDNQHKDEEPQCHTRKAGALLRPIVVVIMVHVQRLRHLVRRLIRCSRLFPTRCRVDLGLSVLLGLTVRWIVGGGLRHSTLLFAWSEILAVTA